MDYAHVGDVLTELVVRITDGGLPLDMSTALERKITLRKPDGTSVQHDAVNDTDGTDGRIKYVTAAGDLDQPGSWRIQGFVRLPPSGEWHTAIGQLFVQPNL